MAVAGYEYFILQSRRIDASHLLMLNAHRLQRCFTLEGAYNGSCVTRQDSKGGYYTLSPDSQFTANTFNLIAVPAVGSSQEKDSGCRTFMYDHTGRRTATGIDADKCW
jgi:Tfp pilus assembly protein PilE